MSALLRLLPQRLSLAAGRSASLPPTNQGSTALLSTSAPLQGNQYRFRFRHSGMKRWKDKKEFVHQKHARNYRDRYLGPIGVILLSCSAIVYMKNKKRTAEIQGRLVHAEEIARETGDKELGAKEDVKMSKKIVSYLRERKNEYDEKEEKKALAAKEARAAQVSSAESAENPGQKRFNDFASLDVDGEPHMTPNDLLDSLVHDSPRPRIKSKSEDD